VVDDTIKRHAIPLTGILPEHGEFLTRDHLEKIASSIRQKYSEMEFLASLKKVGFSDTQMVAETGLNSSPKTRGTLFRAIKKECNSA
jgi:hypothetical protein